MAVRILFFISLLVLAVLTLADKSVTRLYTWPWVFYGEVLLLVPCVAFVGRLCAGRPVARFGGWLDVGFIGFALAAVLSALLSPYRWQSVNIAQVYVSGIALGYVVLHWLKTGDQRQNAQLLAKILGVFFALLAAVSVLQWLLFDVLPLWRSTGLLTTSLAFRNERPFGHSNYTAGAGILMLPWLAALAWQAGGGARAVWLVMSVAALGMIVSSGSRGGLVALFVVLAIAATFFSRRLSGRSRLLIASGLAVVVIAFSLLNPRLRDLVVNRSWNDIARESNRQREAMLEAGLLMGVDRPLTGYGPGAIPYVYPRFRAHLSGGVDSVLQLHNTPVQLWAELGSIGIVFAFLIAVGLARRMRANLREDTDNPPSAWTLAAGLGVCGYGAMAFTDHQLDVLFFAAVLGCYIAVVGSMDVRTTPRNIPHRWRYGLILLTLAIGVVLAGTAWPNLRARSQFSSALELLDAGDEAGFVAQTEKAAATASWETFYFNQLAAHFIEQRFAAKNQESHVRASNAALNYLQASLERDPTQEYAHFNLGWLLLDFGHPAAADHFRQAARLVPDKGGVYFGLGLSLLSQGRAADAAHAFALEWINDPRSATAPIWSTPTLQDLRTQALTTAFEIYARLRTRASSEDLKRQIAYSEALLRWHSGAAADMATLTTSGSPAQSEFFSALPRMETREFIPSDERPWELLYASWRFGLLAPLAAQNRYDPTLLLALARRIHVHTDSFHAFITAPVNEEPALQSFLRRQRTGYGVLMRQNEGEPLIDAYVVNENLMAAQFLAFLFPAKGWLPAKYLLSELENGHVSP